MEKPVEPRTQTRYSINWARGVVKKWRENHPRGARFLRVAAQIDDEILARLVAENRTEWDQVKNIANHYEEAVDKNYVIGENPFRTMKFHQCLVVIIQNCEDRMTRSLKNYLTGKANSLTI